MAKKTDDTITIIEIKRNRATFNVLGSTPLLMNRFSQKAKQQLLSPPLRKNAAEKATTLKHDPVAEFRSSVYLNRDLDRPTRIHAPAEWFKGALCNAAIDIPGCAKAKLERLVQVASPQIDLYGVPRLHFGMVRNSDMNRTPDVRTRACFEEWAARIQIDFVSTIIKEKDLTHLFAAAGSIVGCGDWRPQKGGTFGQFKIVSDNDEDFHRIQQKQGSEAQSEALATPVCFDADTEELLAWFFEEIEGRDVSVTKLMAAE